FIGTGLKKDEFIADCSDLDDIIAFTKSGKVKIVKVAEKAFVGKDIIHVAIFQKNDERTTYNIIYLDGKTSTSYAKRFNITGITRDKEYDLTRGTEKSKVLYFSANLNGEAEVVKIVLSPNCTARNKELDFYFEEQEIKNRGSMGNIVTKYPIRTVKFKEAGRSTLNGRKLWFDKQFGRLNTEEKGIYLGMFEGDDKIICMYKDGTYEITDQELLQRFDSEKILLVEKFDPEKIVTAVYYDNDKLQFNVKRFKVETTTLHSKFSIIKEGASNYLEAVTTDQQPLLIVKTGRGAQASEQKMKLAKLVDVTGWKTIGTKLIDFAKSTELRWEQKEGGLQQKELF
ncbi:MAG: DNA gyrase/topoisomerase IV subunit A, partial [Chitinophagaceae bacterium]|nr:DNA gyrase/topoisomerase IV subunit A [Chitinophagaceae bacterium]